MGRKRSASNRHLPLYVTRRSNRYYLEAKGPLLAQLGNRKSFPLGSSFTEMYSNYIAIINQAKFGPGRTCHTIGQLIDRYLLEVTPTKAVDGHSRELRRGAMLKRVFGEMHPEALTTLHVYELIDLRSETAPVGVNRDVSLLSSVFKKAIRWGVITDNPIMNIEYNQEKPRDRYITHEEYTAFRKIAQKEHPLLAPYMDFKYLTGLRAADIRALTKSQLKDDGIHLTIQKTQLKRIIAWSDALRLVTNNLLSASLTGKKRPHSKYLLPNRSGGKYTGDGWRTVFYRAMRQALEQGVLAEPFCEHDIRAKAGSDHNSVEQAQKFLAHLSVKVTERHYRRKPEVIQPLM